MASSTSSTSSNSPAARRPLGELSVSPLCLGGNVFGWTADKETSFRVLDAYVEAGGNFIDTADSYSGLRFGVPDGLASESVIGEWMASRRNRDDLVVATKVGGADDRKGLRPANIRAAVDDSLRRLGTDRIDLYYTHFDDESVEVADIMATLDETAREGKVRALGASNISPRRLAASCEFASDNGLVGYTALQPHYNLVSRDTYEAGPDTGSEDSLEDVAERWGLGVMPYFALAKGFLTGKYRQATASSADTPRAERASQYLETEHGPRVLAALDRIVAARGGAVSHAALSLAWLLSRPGVVAPIASARNVEQLQALTAVGGVELTAEEKALLDEASGRGARGAVAGG